MNWEKRKHPRLNTFGRFDIRARFRHKGRDYAGVPVVSLSKCGAFLMLANEELTWFAPGDSLAKLEFNLEGVLGIQFGARLAYVLSSPEGGARLGGCGVEFTHIDSSCADRLAEFVHAALAEEGDPA
jgi:hypothetical protein